MMQPINRMIPKVILNATAVFLSVLLLQLPNPAAAQELRVLTWNLYLGAEIQSLAAAKTSDEFFAGVQRALDQIAANNFPDRAEALAAAIIDKNPHLVALQEVYNFTINEHNALPPFRDYLVDLLAALEARGAYYEVAATVENLNLSLPFGPVVVGVIDRDVILAREDIQTQVVDLSAMCPGSESVDGCNYGLVAGITIPDVGRIEFKRGYVAVDVLSGAPPVRLFDTHLEVRDPQPGNLESPLVQRAQAMELTEVLKSVVPADMPLVVVGDINSSPEDTALLYNVFPSPYVQLAQNNYDVWTLRPGKPAGYTCCYAEDLSMEADLYERIDVIFTNKLPGGVKVNVVGNDAADRTSSGRWPSDHAGVAARMTF
jgi:endonuclease/exonuclease/phosphatase family metal-dependent hydrolase